MKSMNAEFYGRKFVKSKWETSLFIDVLVDAGFELNRCNLFEQVWNLFGFELNRSKSVGFKIQTDKNGRDLFECTEKSDQFISGINLNSRYWFTKK